MRITNTLISLLLLTVSSSLFAQAGCDAEAEFKAFDFWVGEWDVTNYANGALAGSNVIEKQEGGCMLLEKWTSAAGGTGTSLNYYNPVTMQWRQLWVSAGAYSIDISGGLVNGSMVLLGKLYSFSGEEDDFRGSWTPNEDGSVRQFFELYNSQTESWDSWFDGRYSPKQD